MYIILIFLSFLDFCRFLLQPKYVLEALRAVEGELAGNADSADLNKKFINMECNGGGNNQKTKKFLNRSRLYSLLPTS